MSPWTAPPTALYASHGTVVEVVDPNAGKVVGQIAQLHGVHGIAIAADLGKGFITNGQSNSVTIFDLKTLAKTGEPATGQNPDAICYEPKTKRVFTFNGRSNDSTAIDAKTNEIAEDASRWAASPNSARRTARASSTSIWKTRANCSRSTPPSWRCCASASLAPCDGPSGLAIDVKEQEAVLGVRQQDDGGDRYRRPESDRHAGHRSGPGRARASIPARAWPSAPMAMAR